MIAASIALAFALYFSTCVLLHSAASIAWKQKTSVTPHTVIACLSWAAFYYLTHAA